MKVNKHKTHKYELITQSETTINCTLGAIIEHTNQIIRYSTALQTKSQHSIHEITWDMLSGFSLQAAALCMHSISPPRYYCPWWKLELIWDVTQYTMYNCTCAVRPSPLQPTTAYRWKGTQAEATSLPEAIKPWSVYT